MSIAQKYRTASQEARQAAEKADLMVFVSFSMPEASLKRIARETAKAGGVMVIRGFKDDSLKATVKAAEELAALQGDMLIHPELFDHYGITEVPVTVIARNSEDGLDGCAVNSELGMCTEHVAVKGDVSLHSALEHLIRESEDKKLSDIA
ncbi:type-F conjugative transfer system pilin assembly protein TrbC, partial [Neisseria gonorrhoeae]